MVAFLEMFLVRTDELMSSSDSMQEVDPEVEDDRNKIEESYQLMKLMREQEALYSPAEEPPISLTPSPVEPAVEKPRRKRSSSSSSTGTKKKRPRRSSTIPLLQAGRHPL